MWLRAWIVVWLFLGHRVLHFWQLSQSIVDPCDGWVQGLVDLEAHIRGPHLRDQKCIGEGDLISNAILSCGLGQNLLQTLESHCNPVNSPSQLVSFEFVNFTKNTQVDQWLHTRVDMLTDLSDLGLLERISRQKSPSILAGFLKVLDDGHTLGQQMSVDPQGWNQTGWVDLREI